MRYVVRKLVFYAVAFWGAITINFCLPRLIPGNPVEILLSREAQGGAPPPGEAKVLEHLLGLGGGSIFTEYWHYLESLAHFNLGLSVTDFPTPVTTVIGSALPWTVALVGVSTILAFLIGTALGALAGWKQSRLLESFIPATTFLTSVPYFWLALLLLYLFGVLWHVAPLNGGYSPTVTLGWSWSFISSALGHAILPGATIVLAQLGGWMLSMRNMTMLTRSEDYVLSAEAKGLSGSKVLIGYAARNAVLPSFTNFGISLGFVVSGSILMEIVFSYPGIGYLLLQAVQNDDYSLMQGLFLVISCAVLGANLIVDLLYGIIDPRTRQGGAS